MNPQLRYILNSIDRLGRLKVLGVSVGMLGILLFVVVFRPLLVEIKSAKGEYHALYQDVVGKRNEVKVVGCDEVEKCLMTRAKVPQAIADLSAKGRELNIHFNSILPQTLIGTSQEGIKKLPIRFMIECAYQSLGEFLDFLEHFPHCLVQVNNLTLVSRDNTQPILAVRLEIYLYVEGSF